MTPPTDTTAALVITAIALAIGAIGALVFRGAGVPGGNRAAGLVGGIVVGLLAGHGGVGALWPDSYDAWLNGGTEEQGELDLFDDETNAGLLGFQVSDVSGVAIDEYVTARKETRAPFEESLGDARAARSDSLRVAAVVLLALLVACTAPYWLPRPRTHDGSGWLGPFIGIVLAGALLGTIVRATGFTPAPSVALTIAAIAALVAPAPSARAFGSLAPWCLLGCFVCLTLVRVLALSGDHTPLGPGSLATGTGLALLLILIGWPLYHRLPRVSVRSARRTLNTAALFVLLPGVCAMTVARIETGPLWGDWLFWALLIGIGLISSDLRWYALARVMQAVGRSTHYTDAERCANAGAGIVQLLLATVAFNTGLIDGRLCLALLVGGAVGEMTVGMRKKIALAMERGDSIMDIFEDDEA